MNNIKYSGLESKRFNLEVFRGSMDAFDIDFLREFYSLNNPDILIFRVPVGDQHKLHQLNTLGKDVVNADTLVYYQVDLNKTEYKPAKNKDLVFKVADSSHKNIFQDLVPKIFHNYTTHYLSNPLLDPRKITEGYMEWAINSIDAPDNLHLLIYLQDKPVAFITCCNDATSAEIILNGVLPEYQSQGIYTDVLRYVKAHYHQMGIPLLKISTQIQNFAVQKVWNREGLVLNSAYVTIHLNKKH